MNLEETVSLLQICDLSNQWPPLAALHDSAMAALLEANEEAKKEIAERNAMKAKRAANDEAKRVVEAKRVAELESKANQPRPSQRPAFEPHPQPSRESPPSLSSRVGPEAILDRRDI